MNEFSQLSLDEQAEDREASACGGDSISYHKPDCDLLETQTDPNNQDIEVINLETEDDKDS